MRPHERIPIILLWRTFHIFFTPFGKLLFSPFFPSKKSPWHMPSLYVSFLARPVIPSSNFYIATRRKKLERCTYNDIGLGICPEFQPLHLSHGKEVFYRAPLRKYHLGRSIRKSLFLAPGNLSWRSTYAAFRFFSTLAKLVSVFINATIPLSGAGWKFVGIPMECLIRETVGFSFPSPPCRQPICFIAKLPWRFSPVADFHRIRFGIINLETQTRAAFLAVSRFNSPPDFTFYSCPSIAGERAFYSARVHTPVLHVPELSKNSDKRFHDFRGRFCFSFFFSRGLLRKDTISLILFPPRFVRFHVEFSVPFIVRSKKKNISSPFRPPV